jgi:hypothetical protein
MRSVLIAVSLVMSASLVDAQSAYVGAAVGTDTTFASSVEVNGLAQIEAGGTAPVIAGRAGLVLGNRWGAEVEVSYTTAMERTVDGGSRFIAPPVFGGVPAVTVFSSVMIESEQRSAAVNALGWFSYPASARVELVLLAGIAFHRAEIEQRLSFELPQLFPPGFPSIGPQVTNVVAYDVGPVVGVEGRVAFGDRFRVVPGLRASGISAGWSLRPTVGVAWVF